MYSVHRGVFALEMQFFYLLSVCLAACCRTSFLHCSIISLNSQISNHFPEFSNLRDVGRAFFIVLSFHLVPSLNSQNSQISNMI